MRLNIPGDSDNGKEGVAGCIHDDCLYLESNEWNFNGLQCKEHGSKKCWICEINSSGEVSASSKNGVLELINSNINFMNLKEKFVQVFLKEPEKSFRKAEITNGDGILTTDGQSVFLGWLLKKHGDEFKTEVVDELLKEKEA